MNKVMLIGNVGKDEPKVKYYDRDQAYATFSLATTERGYTLANGTKVPDRTESKATSFTSRAASATAPMTTSRAAAVMSPRFRPTRSRCWCRRIRVRKNAGRKNRRTRRKLLSEIFN